MFMPFDSTKKPRVLRGMFFLLILCVVSLMGCNPNGEIPLPDPFEISDALQRVWKDAASGYIAITDTAYTEYNSSLLDGTTDKNDDGINTGKDTIVVTGIIEEITDVSLPSGYIYVKVSDDYLIGDGSDEYFAVRWENYTGKFVELWSTYPFVETTLDSARTAYNDSYDSSWQNLAYYTKVNTLVGPLKGDWDGTGTGEDSVVEITDITYTDSYNNDVTYTYSGIIAETTDPSKAEGYIYIKYAQTAFGTPNNYYAIHWQNKTAVSIETSGSSDGHGLPTLKAAKEEYTLYKGYFNIHTAFNRRP